MEQTVEAKLFFSTLAIALSQKGNNPTNLKIKASPKLMSIFLEVLTASKIYQEELKNLDASVESISVCLENKIKACNKFKEKTGVDWPI